jgi:hypothetical protein
MFIAIGVVEKMNLIILYGISSSGRNAVTKPQSHSPVVSVFHFALSIFVSPGGEGLIAASA